MFGKKEKSMMMAMLMLGCSPSVFAQKDVDIPEFSLDEIVVSATRSEKKIIDTAASISVITEKDLEDLHVHCRNPCDQPINWPVFPDAIHRPHWFH